MDGAQPASKFLDKIRVPRNLTNVDGYFNSIDIVASSEFQAVSKEERGLSLNNLGPLTVKHSEYGNIKLTLFWKSEASTPLALYMLASCYCKTTFGSCDAESFFSRYYEILDEKRRPLDGSTMKAFCFFN